MRLIATYLIAACALFTWSGASFGAQPLCAVSSGDRIMPVVELYTSEGCSSCPPADEWASSLKGSGAVVQAFHVGYWNYIGWVDRFAAPAYTARQREVAAANKLRGIYTPQVVLNGKDWPGWHASRSRLIEKKAAQLSITLEQSGANQFQARVVSIARGADNSAGEAGPLPWSAYWTVTEHGHNSKVQAGENAGEFLKHDFVVRQYTRAGDYASTPAKPQILGFRSIAVTAGQPRQINLVVFDKKTGDTLQAVSLQCAG